MQQQQPRDLDPVSPFVLMGAAVQFYVQAFRPLFVTAAVAAAIPTLLSLLIQPEESAVWFLWTTLLLAVELAAHSAVLWMAAAMRSGRKVGLPAAFMAAVAFGPRYFAGAFLLFSLVLLSGWTVVLVPLAIYVVVRLSLYGPAIVVEDLSIIESFRRSWQLVEGRWWRTFGMEAALVCVPLAGSMIPSLLLGMDAHIALLFVVNVLITALMVPLLMCFFLMLFDDYRRVSDTAPRYEPERRDGPHS